MAKHKKLVIFYLALQRVSQYLGHLITTDTFLSLYTSAENETLQSHLVENW